MDRRVLVIDDEPCIRDLLATFFRRKGYRVDTATSGSEGWKRITEEQHSAIVLDLYLGDENGLDVLKAIKTARPNIPVILLTAYKPDEKLTELARLRGASALLSKSIRMNELLEEIEKILQAAPASLHS